LEELRDNIIRNLTIKYTYSKELMTLRAQERLMFQVREYDRAEAMRAEGDRIEREEKARIESVTLAQKLERDDAKLRLFHQAQVKSLMKRI
jgi:hypothetical protein